MIFTSGPIEKNPKENRFLRGSRELDPIMIFDADQKLWIPNDQ